MVLGFGAASMLIFILPFVQVPMERMVPREHTIMVERVKMVPVMYEWWVHSEWALEADYAATDLVNRSRKWCRRW